MGMGRQSCLLEKTLLIYSEIMGKSPVCFSTAAELFLATCDKCNSATTVLKIIKPKHVPLPLKVEEHCKESQPRFPVLVICTCNPCGFGLPHKNATRVIKQMVTNNLFHIFFLCREMLWDNPKAELCDATLGISAKLL